MLAWIKENSGKTLESLWKDNLPEDADKALKQGFYHDFHWLLNQGFVLLLADSTVHLAKANVPAQPSAKSPEKKDKAPASTEQEGEKPQSEEPKNTTEPVTEPTPSPKEETEPTKEDDSSEKAPE